MQATSFFAPVPKVCHSDGLVPWRAFGALRKSEACEFAHHLSREQIKPFMNKGERISRFVAELATEEVDLNQTDIAKHPFYRAFFQCWNEQRYYEAHDVLEQLWLNTDTEDDHFFKGLIQAAGAFVHLQKNFEHPTHVKHGRRLQPAVRLFRLAKRNLSIFAPKHHGLDVAALCQLLRAYADQIIASDYKTNPWSPKTAPKLRLASSNGGGAPATPKKGSQELAPPGSRSPGKN
jgi:predicted metal-dependent hydrolase